MRGIDLCDIDLCGSGLLPTSSYILYSCMYECSASVKALASFFFCVNDVRVQA